MDPLKYGNLIYYYKNNTTFILQLGQLTQAIIKICTNKNQVDLMREGKLVLSYVDSRIDSNQFDRSIGKNNYLYVRDGAEYKLSLFTVNKSAKNISNLKAEKPLKKSKIATMDFETFKNTDGKLVPYLLCWYDGVVTKSYFLTDYNSPEQMITKSIKDLLRKKYNGFKIYLNNFSNFDCIFLLDTLTKLGFFHPVVNNGRFIKKTKQKKSISQNISNSYVALDSE
jgi:hypothetical protein